MSFVTLTLLIVPPLPTLPTDAPLICPVPATGVPSEVVSSGAVTEPVTEPPTERPVIVPAPWALIVPAISPVTLTSVIDPLLIVPPPPTLPATDTPLIVPVPDTGVPLEISSGAVTEPVTEPPTERPVIVPAPWALIVPAISPVTLTSVIDPLLIVPPPPTLPATDTPLIVPVPDTGVPSE